jgi:hypothetical protein
MESAIMFASAIAKTDSRSLTKNLPFGAIKNQENMANISTNLLDVILTAAEQGTIQTAIATIDTTLDPVESTLTDEGRASLLSLDVNNKVFAEEALQEVQTNGSMLPSAVNALFLKNDLELFNQLDGIESQLENVLRKVKDAKRVAGHEAYAMALTIYTLYRSLAAVGVAGAQQSADRLGERFAQNGGGGQHDGQGLL